jgi:hypothetical protein
MTVCYVERGLRASPAPEDFGGSAVAGEEPPGRA